MDNNMDINDTDNPPKNSFSAKAIQKKLENILYSSNYCGICFETGKDLCSLNTVYESSRELEVKLLKDVVDCLFRDTAKVPASEYLCKKCIGMVIDAYRFIQNTKETAKLINIYVKDFVSKTIDINNQLEPNYNYEDSKVIIVLRNHEKTCEFPIEVKALESETKLKNDVQHKNNVVTQKQAKNILKRASKNTDELPKKNVVIQKEAKNTIKRTPKKASRNTNALPGKQSKIESKQTTAKPIRESEIEKKVSVKVPAVNKIMVRTTEGYECTKCKVIFPKFKLWKEHEQDSHKKAVECKICSKTFDSHRLLTQHYRMHNKLKCRICNNLVLDTDLSDHLKLNHENETHSCGHCNKTYYIAPELTAHVKIAHSNVKSFDEDDANPQCLMCLEYFKKEDLKTHKCRDKCPDCTEIPCIHYKYLIHIKEQVLNHMNKIKCLDCDYFCKRKASLIGHVNREHIDYHPFTCNECGMQFFSKNGLARHITEFHVENLICAYCDKTFKKKIFYNSHLDLCKNEKREFQCDICPASFVTADELYNHGKIKHSAKTIPCDLCNRVFLTEENLREHKSRTHRSTVQLRKLMRWECLLCDQDNKFDTKGEYNQHMETHGSNVKYICRICKTECKNLISLKNHNRSHKEKKVEKCSICDKVVKSLRQHMRTHRVITNKAICDICGKSFQLNAHLRVHRLIHLERVPCNVCSKPVKPSHIKRHMRIHKGTAIKRKNKCSARCDFCDYIPQSFVGLEAHVNRYHLNIKPYVCDKCGTPFGTETALKLHGRSHSDEKKFACELCGFKFRYNNSLRKHMLLHKGEKPHKCDICGESYICPSMLKDHKLVHAGKRIRCPLCGMLFYKVGTMRMHFKRQHWEDKGKKYDPKEMLDEEFHYLFEDRRKVTVDVYNSG